MCVMWKWTQVAIEHLKTNFITIIAKVGTKLYKY